MSYPITKNSPFERPLSKILFRMQRSGVMQNIWNRYQIIEETQCEERKVIEIQILRQNKDSNGFLAKIP